MADIREITPWISSPELLTRDDVAARVALSVIEIAAILAAGALRVARGHSPNPSSSTPVNLRNSSESFENRLEVRSESRLHVQRVNAPENAVDHGGKT